MNLAFIIWNGSPEIFTIGTFALRWYGLLFALGFLFSQQVLYYIYKKEGKPTSDIDTLTIYMVVATVVSARLGHVFFYQPEMLINDPLNVFLPFEFNPTFRFTGYQGLASHGAAFGILFALWLYSRKKKPGQNYLQVLDRIVIVVALTGGMIRMGNFFNSEIIGKPDNGPQAFVFMNQATSKIMDEGTPVESIKILKDDKKPKGVHGRVPVDLYLFFKPGTDEARADNFLRTTVTNAMQTSPEFIDQPAFERLRYNIAKESDGTIGAKVSITAIARHPAQLYEAISCFILFAILFGMWTRRKANTPQGRIFGVFLIVLWTLRFLYEFLKENQVPFENGLTLNMGQTLSIPLVLAGIYVLFRSYQKPFPDADLPAEENQAG